MDWQSEMNDFQNVNLGVYVGRSVILVKCIDKPWNYMYLWLQFRSVWLIYFNFSYTFHLSLPGFTLWVQGIDNRRKWSQRGRFGIDSGKISRLTSSTVVLNYAWPCLKSTLKILPKLAPILHLWLHFLLLSIPCTHEAKPGKDKWKV